MKNKLKNNYFYGLCKTETLEDLLDELILFPDIEVSSPIILPYTFYGIRITSNNHLKKLLEKFTSDENIFLAIAHEDLRIAKDRYFIDYIKLLTTKRVLH